MGDGGRALLTVLLVLSLPLAGCIGMGEDVTDEPLDQDDAQRESEPSDQMTAQERVDDEEGADANVPPFYSRTTYTLTGQVLLDRLPILLSTVNGEVTVSTQEGEGWELVATLEGRGLTPQDAQEARDRMSFTWTIGEPGDHVLVGQVEQENPDDEPVQLGAFSQATLELVVPKALVAGLQTGSTNGDVIADGLNAYRLDLDTTNGDIVASAAGLEQVSLDTTNGNIRATLHPAEDGQMSLDSTNGKIQLRVPEDTEHGYEVEADTTNGEVTIELSDGTTSYSDDGDEATFRTTSYEARDIRTQVSLDTTNGDITVASL